MDIPSPDGSANGGVRSQMKVSHVEQFQKELDSLITRWAHESDITVSEVIGALEIAKTTELLRVHAPGIKKLAKDVDPDD